MSDREATTAEDTWVNSAKPAKNYGSGSWVRLGGATRGVLVQLPIENILGRTVEAAPLAFHVGPGHVSQTYTVKRVTSDWSADAVSWSGSSAKPSVGSTSVSSGVVTAQADGTVVTIDIAVLMQQIADGQVWRGLWITSDAGSEQRLYANDSGQPAWDLDVELSDNPEQPEGLFPDVGVVGSSKLVLGWRAPDLDGVTGQAEYRVQFSPTDNWAAPASDTGWLPGTLPRHDMTAYSYALTNGTLTGWRVQVRDASGNESTWSDPAHITYDNALGALVLDSPASGTFGDPTLRVQAHLTGGETIKSFRIRVASADDRADIIYNSKVQPGSVGGLIDFELPFRSPKTGKRILRDDQPRWLHVRAWGSKKRSVGEARPDYVETWVLITANDDLVVAKPTGLTVTPVGDGDPRYTYQWTLPSAPDAVLVMDGGEVLERIDSDDWTAASGTYTYTDRGLLAPWRTNAVQLRAVYDDKRSAASNVVNVTPQIKGRWIVTADPDIGAIVLDDAGEDGIESVDTTSVAQKLDGSPYAVTYGPPWMSGPYTGSVSDATSFTKLELLRKNSAVREDVRFVWGTRSLRARISDLSPMPDPDAFFPSHKAHEVKFTVTEIGD